MGRLREMNIYAVYFLSLAAFALLLWLALVVYDRVYPPKPQPPPERRRSNGHEVWTRSDFE